MGEVEAPEVGSVVVSTTGLPVVVAAAVVAALATVQLAERDAGMTKGAVKR